MLPRRAASEFPNDNPELHDGLVWTCPEPRARPMPTLRLRKTHGELPGVLRPPWVKGREPVGNVAPLAQQTEWEPERQQPCESQPGLTVVARSAPFLEVSEEPRVTEDEPGFAAASEADEPPITVASEAKTPFAGFVEVLARLLLERGATRSAGVLPRMFHEGRVPPGCLDAPVLTSLQASGILGADGALTDEFLALVSAWRGVLDGTQDLPACGNTLLDAWAAGVLGAFLNVPRERTDDLRRELRKRGVAAFGLLSAA